MSRAARLDEIKSQHPVFSRVHFLRYEWLRFGRDATYKGLMGRGTYRQLFGGHRPWVARITGRDATFGYRREFVQGYLDLSEANRSGDRGVHIYFLVEEGKPYEVSYPLSPKQTHRAFIMHDGERAVELERWEVDEWLSAASA